MALDALGRIVAFEEKPSRPAEAQDKPGFALASMGIYVFDGRCCARCWKIWRRPMTISTSASTSCRFSSQAVALMPMRFRAGGRRLRSGAISVRWTLFMASMPTSRAGAVPLDPSWPLLVGQRHAGSLRAADEPADPPRRSGCGVGDGATVGTGSVLRNVVVLPGARGIGRDVLMSNAIVTGDAIVPDGFDLERALALGSPWCTVSEGRHTRSSPAAPCARFPISPAASFDPARDRLNDNPPGAPWAAQPLLQASCRALWLTNGDTPCRGRKNDLCLRQAPKAASRTRRRLHQ